MHEDSSLLEQEKQAEKAPVADAGSSQPQCDASMQTTFGEHV
jgi:hypothetical protein